VRVKGAAKHSAFAFAYSADRASRALQENLWGRQGSFSQWVGYPLLDLNSRCSRDSSTFQDRLHVRPSSFREQLGKTGWNRCLNFRMQFS
jgi:hypothetical protein